MTKKEYSKLHMYLYTNMNSNSFIFIKPENIHKSELKANIHSIVKYIVMSLFYFIFCLGLYDQDFIYIYASKLYSSYFARVSLFPLSSLIVPL